MKRGEPLEAIIQEKRVWENELDVLVRIARRSKKWASKCDFQLSWFTLLSGGVMMSCYNGITTGTTHCRYAKSFHEFVTEEQKFGLSTERVKKKDAANPIYTVDGYANVAKHVSNDPCPYFSGVSSII